MPHDACSVANLVIAMALEQGVPVTGPEVMNIVYMAHGVMLGTQHRPMLRQEVEAWQEGPTVPELRRSLTKYRDSRVSAPVNTDTETYDRYEEDAIRTAWEAHRRMGGRAMREIVTDPGSPWHRKWTNRKDESSVIPQSDIETFYVRMVRSRMDARPEARREERKRENGRTERWNPRY